MIGISTLNDLRRTRQSCKPVSPVQPLASVRYQARQYGMIVSRGAKF